MAVEHKNKRKVWFEYKPDAGEETKPINVSNKAKLGKIHKFVKKLRGTF